MSSKGKGIAGKDSSGKRKRGDNDKVAAAGCGWKRKNGNVLQFFEDAAVEFDCDDSDDEFDDDFDFLDEYEAEAKVEFEPGRFEGVPFLPKEEELSGDELEKLLEERYRSGSGYVRYAEDDNENKRSVDRSFLIPSAVEPTIWKVKCKVGRERHTVFCLMQKYVDLKMLGTKLQIISAFAVEHVKGFVFVEAETQSYVTEACNQLADVYYALVTQVPTNEVCQLLVVRKRYNEVKEGTWARVKNGIYKGDIAQVVAVNNERKRATVKMIPRLDLQALSGKYGGGAILKKTKSSVPAARLISSSELEEFRPLLQRRRDRDTGQVFEFLDGLMLKDGFLYKKVAIDSLSFWDVNPSEDELQKFTLSTNDESDNLEWLSQLYGEQKRKRNVKINKGGGKEEGSSGSNEQSSFELHDLVLFGKRDFGMVIGMEKDENYKILKDGSEGPVTMTLGQKDLKYVPVDKKFTALDHRMKTISINDTVRILDGPTKGRHGSVKQIYRGIIFLYDESNLDNAYFCTKSQMSEKVKHPESACPGKVEEGPSGFEDIPASPKSPLSPKKPWQTRDNVSDADRRDKDGIFSVGHSLRIRVGPLKGYLCRVLAVRYSDVTVKLDSQQKVLTVKREHLSEVRGKTSATSMSDDPGLSSSFKPFDLLGAGGCTNDWLQGANGSADGDSWNVGRPSNERSAWPTFPSSGASLQEAITSTALPNSVDLGSGKGVEDSAWISKVNSNQNSSWGVAGNDKSVNNSENCGIWGGSDGGWGKCSGTGTSSTMEKAKVFGGDHGDSWKIGGSSSFQEKEDTACQVDPWDKGKEVMKAANSWSDKSAVQGQPDSWNKGKGAEDAGGWNDSSSGWDKPKACEKSETWGEGSKSVVQATSKSSGNEWAEANCTNVPAEDSWGKAADKWGNKNNSSESSDWKSSAAASKSQVGAWGQMQGQNESKGWNKNSLGEHSNAKLGELANDSNWGKGTTRSQGFSSWNRTDGIDSWDQPKSCKNDQGFDGGRGSGGRRGRGGNCSGRGQSGRGIGRPFDGGQFSSWNEENQPRSSWGSASDGKCDKGSGWGKNKDWSSDSGKEGKGWCTSGSRGSAESNKLNLAGPSFERSTCSTGWQQQISWDKGRDGDNKSSTWGKSTHFHDKDTALDVDHTWAKAKDLEDQVSEGPEDSWGKAADRWGSKELSSRSKEWRISISAPACDDKDWSKGCGGSQEENTISGWKDAGGWKSGGDGGQGKMDGWNKPNSFGPEGVSCLNKSGGNDSLGKSKFFENDRGLNEDHGSGGRRGGRGRDQSGRGRGRSFGRGQFSSWNKDSQDDPFHGNASCMNHDQESNWGKGWSKDGENECRDLNKSGDIYSSGNKSWSQAQAGSWENSSAGNDERGSTWCKGKGWNNNDGGDGKGWNKSADPEKDSGIFSLEKTSSPTGCNGASSGSSGWGQKSWEKGKGRASEDISWGKAMKSQDEAKSLDIDGGSIQGVPWGKAAGNGKNNFGASQGWKSSTGIQSQVGGWAGEQRDLGQSLEEKSVGEWSKGGGCDDSDGWNMGRGNSQGNRWNKEYGSEGGGWSKSAGNNIWGSSRNFENDTGFGVGCESGGRRGRGGFRRGRGQSGMGGGRSSGRGQLSSWKNEGGSSSWENTPGGDNGLSSWGRGWSNRAGEDKGGWDRGAGWKNKGQDADGGAGGGWA